MTDWATFEPVDLGVALAATLRSLHPRQWEPAGFLKMLADRDAYDALLAGGDLAAIKATWDGRAGRVRQGPGEVPDLQVIGIPEDPRKSGWPMGWGFDYHSRSR